MQLAGKRIIVTGGARGMGASTVAAYAAEGAHVVSFDVDDGPGAEVAGAADDKGPGRAVFVHCDVSDPGQVFSAFEEAVSGSGGLGGLDALAHAAGIESAVAAEAIPPEEWDRILDVNARGTMLTNQAAFRSMKDGGGGSIINFASAAGTIGQPGGAHYAASKGAVLAWTRTAAQEWGHHGVRVNAVAPAIWTGMFEEFRSRLDAASLAQLDAVLAGRIPLGGTLGDPDTDMAPVMVFLAGDGSRFITGQTIAVDGGLMMVR